ncbi:LacI family transcriptional regulator [Sulfitobacter sp. SK012]|uniref:substrate-binding domain-containing protein n=1 Tax=Sulfitobacter sp. SK012 TaxID=1389005 RepID=UPI000E0C230A|nr:substrate-binding domain-containing protein [Sulfitobacter sp. SK012]AXI44756.1 LacI family transcriptional regulator [Sulfitobacter sp. SK012]
MNLKELADALELSQTTVSRALNGYPEVSEGTRLRVLSAARSFNYRPSAGARNLATGRSMAVRHIIPLSANHEMMNIIFSDFIAGTGEIYAEHGYDMIVSVVPEAQELQSYRDAVARGSVEGFMIHGPRRNDPRLPLLQELGVPFFVHGRSTGYDEPYAWLDVNNRRAIERATNYLIELGHQRIGLINGGEQMDFAQRRREGYVTAHVKAGISTDTTLMTSGDMTEPQGHIAALVMLDLPDPPTAFVASSILSTLGIRRAVESRGLMVGRDISIICFDDDITTLPNGSPAEPTFTASRSSVRAAGRRCAELLIDRINNQHLPPHQELWEAELILGGSTAVAKKDKTT